MEQRLENFCEVERENLMQITWGGEDSVFPEHQPLLRGKSQNNFSISNRDVL